MLKLDYLVCSENESEGAFIKDFLQIDYFHQNIKSLEETENKIVEGIEVNAPLVKNYDFLKMKDTLWQIIKKYELEQELGISLDSI